jgi:GNAT superfamily N-acetyltransferase
VAGLQQSGKWLRRGLRRLYVKVATTCYRRIEVLARDLEALPGGELLPGFELRFLEKHELPAYQALRPGRPLQEALSRLARGDYCVAMWHQGRIVHAGWVATRQVYIPYLERDLLLLPSDIYSHDWYTLPSYRGRGIASARGVRMISHFRERGFRRSVMIVAAENELGAAQARTLGCRPLGRYAFLRLGRIHHPLMPFPEAAGRLL